MSSTMPAQCPCRGHHPRRHPSSTHTQTPNCCPLLLAVRLEMPNESVFRVASNILFQTMDGTASGGAGYDLDWNRSPFFPHLLPRHQNFTHNSPSSGFLKGRVKLKAPTVKRPLVSATLVHSCSKHTSYTFFFPDEKNAPHWTH
jgi:hypothetical protein